MVRRRAFRAACCLNQIVVLERFFSRKERAKLFRSWAGSASMWIKVISKVDRHQGVEFFTGWNFHLGEYLIGA